MPQSLADGKRKITVMTTAPADLAAPTLTELNAGTDISCRVLKSDYKMGPSGSETVDETPLCVKGKGKSWGESNFDGNITVFRYFDATGKAETATTGTPGAIGDAAYQLLSVKGTPLWFADRETSKDSTEPWAVGDEVSVYQGSPDDGQHGDGSGYIKRTFPIGIVTGEVNGVVAAGA